MCGTCGCAPEHRSHHATKAASPITLEVMENILVDNDERAAGNRRRFTAAGVFAANLMSSPGAGKTRLLEATAGRLGARELAVIEGDLETENDAQRLRARGVAAHQITTGTACHLDAALVAAGADALDLAAPRYLFIENVGNLVCPANFDLGQHANVVLLATTEGDDKPAKYPPMFRAADLVLITKIDLAPVLEDFDLARARAAIARIQPDAHVIACSAKSGEGLDEWLDWLRAHAFSR